MKKRKLNYKFNLQKVSMVKQVAIAAEIARPVAEAASTSWKVKTVDGFALDKVVVAEVEAQT